MKLEASNGLKTMGAQFPGWGVMRSPLSKSDILSQQEAKTFLN
jgi:hypothetical protein